MADIHEFSEMPLRKLLQRHMETAKVIQLVQQKITDPGCSWDEQRPLWYYLMNTGNESVVAQSLITCLENRVRFPFDILIQLSSHRQIQPGKAVLESLLKGLRRLNAHEDIVVTDHWDHLDSRLKDAREQVLGPKRTAVQNEKENLRDKFIFLRSQRMFDQAARALRRLIELYPEDEEFRNFETEFKEQRAREVLSQHRQRTDLEKLEQTKTEVSPADREMLSQFLLEGEKLAMDKRELATDIAIAFLFMDDFTHAAEILAWAPPSVSNDWLRAELLYFNRRFLEAIDFLNVLEVKYVEDPETTFAVNYLRALCLHGLGQRTLSHEIMQSLVRVRPQYRSAQALLLQWSEGSAWD